MGRLLRQILLSDEDISASITGLFPIVAEEETELPYIQFRRTRLGVSECRGSSMPVHPTYDITVWAADYDQSCEIADKVIKCLQGSKARDGDTYISNIYLLDSDEGDGGDAYYQRLIFQLNTNNLNI